jgi:hypothetical protein
LGHCVTPEYHAPPAYSGTDPGSSCCTVTSPDKCSTSLHQLSVLFFIIYLYRFFILLFVFFIYLLLLLISPHTSFSWSSNTEWTQFMLQD